MSNPYPIPKVIGNYQGFGSVTQVSTSFPKDKADWGHLYYAQWSEFGDKLTVRWCTETYSFSRNAVAFLDKKGKDSRIQDGNRIVKSDQGIITMADMVHLCLPPYDRQWVYMLDCNNILVSNELKN